MGVREKRERRFLEIDRKGPNTAASLVFIGGVFLLMAGVVISMALPKHPEIQSLIDACMVPSGAPLAQPQLLSPEMLEEAAALIRSGADACRVAVYQFERSEHVKSQIDFWPIMANVLSSLGLATLVALIVSVMIESKNRDHLLSILDKKTREISEAVMQGMFNRQHPGRLVDLVSEHVLQRELIRDSLSVNYVFTKWDPPENEDVSRLTGKRFIAVKATLISVATNVVTNQPVGSKTAKVPICIVLPNPMLDELKSSVEISQVWVDGVEIPDDIIAEKNKEIQQQLKDDGLTDVRADFGERELSSGQSLRVQLVYTMIKELEDSELFRTLQISRNLSISVYDNTGWNLKIRAKSIGHGVLGEVSCHDSTRHWQVDDLLLPHQGVLIWWKEKLAPRTLSDGKQGRTPEGEQHVTIPGEGILQGT